MAALPEWLEPMAATLTRERFTGPEWVSERKLDGIRILVGYFDGSDFVFAGKVGTGFDTKLLLELKQRLSALEVPQAPFTRAAGLPRLGVHWVRPEIVVEVAFMEWTSHDKLCHPRLVGVRNDKTARDVVREGA